MKLTKYVTAPRLDPSSEIVLEFDSLKAPENIAENTGDFETRFDLSTHRTFSSFPILNWIISSVGFLNKQVSAQGSFNEEQDGDSISRISFPMGFQAAIVNGSLFLELILEHFSLGNILKILSLP